ncbi:DMT family transporter [Azospira restricta]|uniref:DMT family transporter n=1 Tax=Azospira restricta TaxID=404405 RepID=A0A974PWR1_9RHOO|nr:DMT family transporter [Azospira restricta]QRJ62553.1 DMT family transporter [Azospira restricta]
MAEKPAVSGVAAGASRGLAVTALVTGALVWGLIWYPYRVLRDAGIAGVPSTTLTYAIAFALALLIWRPWPTRPAHPWLMVGLAFAAGGCNLGYVMATLSGEVMRVLLLFYLAPLWTVLLAWTLLGERLNRFGAFVVLLSLAGAATMLWRPDTGLPLPRDLADWYGLGAGFCFALFNVLSRRARDLPVSQRILVSFVGVIVLGAALGGVELPPPAGVPSSAWGLLLLTGGLLLVINVVVQYGLAHTPANQAIVIMLSEVGFAAVSSWLLAGELLGLQEWIGGAMIIAASLFSTRMEQ